MTQPIALPTIHLNGTGAKSLREQYRAVRLAAKATADAHITAASLLHGSILALRRGKKNWHVCVFA